MKNTTPMLPGFHLQSLRRKPQSAQQKLVKEMALLKQKSFKQIGELYFNTAMIYGELKKYLQAISHMKTYLNLAPEAPNVRATQDQIYKWEFMLEKGE